ncbi:MAG: SDR family oxidoreductase [Thermodesulfobacteriota bacterium]
MSAPEKKTVFITGGSSGIGLSAARLFAEKGDHVVLFARDQDRLQKALSEVSACSCDSSQCISCLPMDVADADSARSAVSLAVDKHGPPDAFVNCAGRAKPMPFSHVTDQQFDETMKINLYGVWNTTRAVLPYLRKPGGRLVHTSSVAGLIGVYGYTDYCASKFAIIGLCEALRAELLPMGIRVSVLCPPDTDTPGLAEENKTKPQETFAISENAKLLSADDVAKALLSGMAANKFLIIPGADAKLSVWAHRLVPGLVRSVMDRAVSKVQKK